MNTSSDVAALRVQATALAGGLGDLAQRASVYHHLYDHSGGNHCFPLLAAHGALWASGYFRRGMCFGAIVAAARGFAGADAPALMTELRSFADAFRDINRHVCVETFLIYQITVRLALRKDAEDLVPHDLLTAMDRCHAAGATGARLCPTDRRTLFEAFFRWEQATIVGPAITAAFRAFEWPLIKQMVLRPAIDFAYFRGPPLRFANFGDADERIAMGLRAYDRAEARGWDRVESDLRRYAKLPHAFRQSPAACFGGLAAHTPAMA